MQYFNSPDAYTKSGDAIYGEEEFMKNFGVGDLFWTIVSVSCTPIVVDGPYRIVGFGPFDGFPEHDFGGMPLGPWVALLLEGGSGTETIHSVRDLTNFHHGVAGNEEAAKRQLARMKEAWNTDIELSSYRSEMKAMVDSR